MGSLLGRSQRVYRFLLLPPLEPQSPSDRRFQGTEPTLESLALRAAPDFATEGPGIFDVIGLLGQWLVLALLALLGRAPDFRVKSFLTRTRV